MLSRLFSSKSKKTSVTVGVSVCASELHIVAIERSGDAVSLNSVSSIPYDQHQPLKQQLSAALSPFARSTCNVSIVLSQHMYQWQVISQKWQKRILQQRYRGLLSWFPRLQQHGFRLCRLPVKSRSGGQKINVFAAERSSLVAVAASMAKERQAAYTYPHQRSVSNRNGAK